MPELCCPDHWLNHQLLSYQSPRNWAVGQRVRNAILSQKGNLPLRQPCQHYHHSKLQKGNTVLFFVLFFIKHSCLEFEFRTPNMFISSTHLRGLASVKISQDHLKGQGQWSENCQVGIFSSPQLSFLTVSEFQHTPPSLPSQMIKARPYSLSNRTHSHCTQDWRGVNRRASLASCGQMPAMFLGTRGVFIPASGTLGRACVGAYWSWSQSPMILFIKEATPLRPVFLICKPHQPSAPNNSGHTHLCIYFYPCPPSCHMPENLRKYPPGSFQKSSSTDLGNSLICPRTTRCLTVLPSAQRLTNIKLFPHTVDPQA